MLMKVMKMRALIMMSLFLDFLMKDAMQNPSKLVPYTQEMSDEIDDLLADVVID